MILAIKKPKQTKTHTSPAIHTPYIYSSKTEIKSQPLSSVSEYEEFGCKVYLCFTQSSHHGVHTVLL